MLRASHLLEKQEGISHPGKQIIKVLGFEGENMEESIDNIFK